MSGISSVALRLVRERVDRMRQAGGFTRSENGSRLEDGPSAVAHAAAFS